MLRTAPAWLRVAPTAFAVAWGGNHFTPLLHLYKTLGGNAPWQANLLLGMYVFGLVPGLLVAASLADRYGRKPVVAGGLICAAVGSVLLAAGLGSFALLAIGRVFAGLGVGVGMSVGSSWIKELSAPQWDQRATPTSGARRSSMALTLGFAIGAGVTGCLAQWAPAPGITPYVVHLALCAVATAVLLRAPETLTQQQKTPGSWWRHVGVPAVRQPTFRWVIIPAAPWVFAAAGVAYAIMPSLVETRLGDFATLYATLLTVLTLGVGAVAQTRVVLLNRVTRGRALVVGLAGMTTGMGLAAIAAVVQSPVLVVVVAAILGASYGVCVIAGLLITQSLATPHELAGVTGAYYSLTYLGFLLPTVLAAAAPLVPYTTGLIMVAAVCATSLAVVAHNLRREVDHERDQRWSPEPPSTWRR